MKSDVRSESERKTAAAIALWRRLERAVERDYYAWARGACVHFLDEGEDGNLCLLFQPNRVAEELGQHPEFNAIEPLARRAVRAAYEVLRPLGRAEALPKQAAVLYGRIARFAAEAVPAGALPTPAPASFSLLRAEAAALCRILEEGIDYPESKTRHLLIEMREDGEFFGLENGWWMMSLERGFPFWCVGEKDPFAKNKTAEGGAAQELVERYRARCGYADNTAAYEYYDMY